MKTIQQAMIEEIYTKADKIARVLKQTVGEKNDLCITLQQLELILSDFME